MMSVPSRKRTATGKSTLRGKALIVDDEPEYLEWVREFLEANGLQAVFATNVPTAFAALEGEKKFAVVLVDMNILALGAISPDMAKKMPLVDKYPGIAVAFRARNRGYGAHEVIGYTVHDDDAADAELSKLNCRYVLKARPEALKSVLRASFAPRPPRPPKGPRRK